MRMLNRSPRSIDASRAYRQLREGAILLLDAREASEWNAWPRCWRSAHAPESAGPPALRADRPVVTICRSGTRSARAASRLRVAGLDVANLTGGLNSWVRHLLSLVTEGNQPGRLT